MPTSHHLFGDLSFRQAVPRSVSNVGNMYHQIKTTTTPGAKESVTFGKIWKLPSSAQRSPGSVTVMEELVRELAQARGNLVRSITFVRNCRIPVIKVVATSSEDVTCHIDISESTASHGGLRASSLVKDLISKNPSIRPLIVVVKQYLKERRLMKAQYNDGGMSSYALFVLLVTYLKQVKCLNKPNKQGHHLFGRLLLNFFCLYGKQTNFETTGISIQNGFYSLVKHGRVGVGPCCIDDPISPGVNTHVLNLGEGIYKIKIIKDAFKDAFEMMHTRSSLKSMLRVKWRSDTVV